MFKKTSVKQPSLRSNRRKLIEAMVNRGERPYNIWTCYSSKNQKDVVLLSDPEYLNFALMEGDTGISSYEIGGERYMAGEEEDFAGTVPDAIVQLCSGATQWREVSAVEDMQEVDERKLAQRKTQTYVTKNLGFEYLRVSPLFLKNHAQLIENWRRIVPMLAAAKHSNLQRYIDRAHAFVDAEELAEICSFLDLFPAAERSLAQAGLMRCIQLGLIDSDLAQRPLRPVTRLKARND